MKSLNFSLMSIVAATVACGPAAEAPPPANSASASPAAVAASPAPSALPLPTLAPSVASAPPNVPATAATPEKAAKPARPRLRLDVPVGTLLPIQILTAISTGSSHVGESVGAQLTEDVSLNGFKLDHGAEVQGRVLTCVAANGVKGKARLVVAFDGVMENGEKLSIETEPIDSLGKLTSDKEKKVVLGGALASKGDEIELPRGARLTLKVTR